MAQRRFDTQLQGITDLTLLTPIRPGPAPGFDVISYANRLRAVLQTLNAIRLAARESSDPPTPFTDAVSRFRIVHSFRWVVIDPAPGSNAPVRLLLNVCFDGGWEPYMRVIWRDLGTMLDLILCHSVDYRLSRDVSFEAYSAWVRANEVSADFLYLESGRTASDVDYLAQLEARQRVDDATGALDAARLSTPLPGWSAPLPGNPPQAQAMAVAGVNGLAALYALARYFDESLPGGLCLYRAARDILFELIRLDTRRLFGPGHPVREAFWQPLQWFERDIPVPQLTPRKLDDHDGADVQGGIVTPYPTLAGGALLLVAVRDPALALAWLASVPISSEVDTLLGRRPPRDVYLNVALSLAGLRALGAGEARLAAFSQPFREGMEQRAGVLGDWHANHPQYWPLPRRNWPDGGDGHAIDLGSVHLLVQLRHDAQGADQVDAVIADIAATPGLALLSVQPLRRQAGRDGETRESFGFVDGISQPRVAPAAGGSQWSDAVPKGELLLGYPTTRDAVAVPEAADALLDNGSYLVIRKLRQNVARLDALLAANAARLDVDPELLAAKLMGRWRDGRPLAAPANSTNDFTYAADPQGSRCPFHAHVRRANPRAGELLPRIARRGLSYGQPGDADRGLVFMAYNANLAEQYETIQRWMAGANSSGGYSGQGDPFLGVATAGEERVYRCEIDGRGVDIRLGDQPLVEIQWGGYFFVPSIPALRNLGALLPGPAPAAPVPRVPTDAEGWRCWLEDRETGDAAWDYVIAQGGALATPYGVLVGAPALVMEVLRNGDTRYSVSGYGERMSSSIGLGYLGLDGAAHDAQAPAINKAIEAIGAPESFAAAKGYAAAVIAQLREGALAVGLAEAPLDFEALAMLVLQQLCTLWFGLPDGTHMLGMQFSADPKEARARCPLDFIPVARHVFGAHPTEHVSKQGEQAGARLRKAAAAWLASGPELGQWPLTQAIVAAMQPFEAGDEGITARTLAGIMLGFPPTVFANTVACLGVLAATHALWDLQLAWTGLPAQDFGAAEAVLRPALLRTLMAKPVPPMVWRRALVDHEIGGVAVRQGDVVVAGLAAATRHTPPADIEAGHFIAFGGARQDPQGPPMHACPGYAMAMGVTQGVLAAVLEAGTLRATPSPTVLNLRLGVSDAAAPPPRPLRCGC
ncbi:MAG: Dyp-type peroxidase [Pelomonas sp.]|nr:Dyp-type peroxidase [Roseateles sp.]